MAEGRLEEALVILKEGAKTNRKTLPPDSELREMMEKFRSQVKFLSIKIKNSIKYDFIVNYRVNFNPF
jgi:hypothetical protein